jgi:endonuclease/exonuclease/phosphatase family metal-dependent hydrolase
MSTSPDRPLSVLTINIWNRQGPWDERFALLREGIAALEPDVIGMQEVLSDGSHDLAREIVAGLDGWNVVYGEAKPLQGDYSFGNAALSRHPIAKRKVVPLPNADTDEHRSLLIADVQTPFGPLPFCVTHLAWRLNHGYVREQQVAALATALKKEIPIAEETLPLVLTGDFNAGPDATEIRFLKGLHALDGKSCFLADCFGEVGEGPGYTFDGRRNPYAAYTHEAPRRIDYVFTRGPDKFGRGKPLSARVVLDELKDGVAPSDHWGVLAQIRMVKG